VAIAAEATSTMPSKLDLCVGARPLVSLHLSRSARRKSGHGEIAGGIGRERRPFTQPVPTVSPLANVAGVREARLGAK
jgi:hypothetical protein